MRIKVTQPNESNVPVLIKTPANSTVGTPLKDKVESVFDRVYEKTKQYEPQRVYSQLLEKYSKR